MTTNFKIQSLQDSEFAHLFHLDDAELKKIGAIRMSVDKKPGFPCRVSLEDADIGEEVILLHYKHHDINSPYQASGPIFVRKTAKTARFEMNDIPTMLDHRLLSIRGYDKHGMMKDAVVTEGHLLREQLHKLFENQEIQYIHIHNAKPGCFNCAVERV